MENTKENAEKINFLSHYNKKISSALENQNSDEKSQERVSYCEILH